MKYLDTTKTLHPDHDRSLLVKKSTTTFLHPHDIFKCIAFEVRILERSKVYRSNALSVL